MNQDDNKVKSYTYRRFMRDGSMLETTAVVRSRAKKKKEKHGKESSEQ